MRWGRLSRGLQMQGRRHFSSKSAKHYDIIVIGSGAGAKVSTPASKLGFKVAMCEHGFDVFGEHKPGLGGTCLNRGCIPSKMLIHAADVATEIKEAHKYSIKTEFQGVNMEELVTRTSAAVDGDSASILPGYANDELRDLYQGTAKFVGHKRLQVGDQEITGDYIFIATGCTPAVPPIPGLKDTPYLTSTEALRLTKQPKKLIVIGAGYIAVELGHYFGGLGTEVHMLARSKLLRTGVDGEVRDEFDRVFRSQYNVHDGVSMKSVSYRDGEFALEYEKDGETTVLQADQLLVAAGTQPMGLELGLHKTGVEVNEKTGTVVNDSKLRTNVDGIWTLGDVAGHFQFRHSANFEGEYLLENIIHPLKETGAVPSDYPDIDYTGMPWAVFSNPQVAGVGESEEDLNERGASFVAGVCPYARSAMGDARRSDSGMVKLLVERGSRKILGCQIVGYEASTMIHQVIPLMRLGGKLEDLLYMIHIHPALNEIVRNAARKARDALVEAGDDVPLRLRLK